MDPSILMNVLSEYLASVGVTSFSQDSGKSNHVLNNEIMTDELIQMGKETDFSGFDEEAIHLSISNFMDCLYNETNIKESRKVRTDKDWPFEKLMLTLSINFDSNNTDALNLIDSSDTINMTFTDITVKKLVYNYLISIIKNVESNSKSESIPLVIALSVGDTFYHYNYNSMVDVNSLVLLDLLSEQLESSRDATSTIATDDYNSIVPPIDNVASTMKVGDIVSFGRYSQGTAEEIKEIEWTVLDIDNGKGLLLSNKILDISPFNPTRKPTDWENSVIRKWLNKNFYNSAFNDDEKNKIIETRLSNPNTVFKGTMATNTGYGGNDTYDKVFFLNIEEAKKYLNKELLIALPTAKVANFVLEDSWWLRSMGASSKNDTAAFVNKEGLIRGVGGLDTVGISVDTTSMGVRPAIWYQLSGEAPIIDKEKKEQVENTILNPVEIKSIKVKTNSAGTPEAYIQFKNIGEKKLIAFDFDVKCFDAYGNVIKGYGRYDVYRGTYQEKALSPGKVSPSNWHWGLYGFDNTKTIEVTITRYLVEDTAAVEIPPTKQAWIKMD
ncbi:MAG: DUF6273 domain-containing protein [Christensenellales bacterium]